MGNSTLVEIHEISSLGFHSFGSGPCVLTKIRGPQNAQEEKQILSMKTPAGQLHRLFLRCEEKLQGGERRDKRCPVSGWRSPGPGALSCAQFSFPAPEVQGPRSFSVTFRARSHLTVAPGGIKDSLSLSPECIHLTDHTACDEESSPQMCLETSCPCDMAGS